MTHPQLLELLAGIDGGKWVPKWSGWPLRLLPGGSFDWANTTEVSYLGSRANDAHAHIELAAWKLLREWCWKQGGYCSVLDLVEGSVTVCLTGGDEPDVNLGTGPDDIIALCRAVTYAKENP